MSIQKGIYLYNVKYKSSIFKNLPSMLNDNIISSQGILIQLVVGKADIYSLTNRLLVSQGRNYSLLPDIEGGRTSYSILSDFFDVDITTARGREACNHFLRIDRRNEFVYSHMLDELSHYFVCRKKTAVEGFVHLYRLLEFMSYSFPLIYSSTSMNYRGSFTSLQKFFQGESVGEIGFFKRFLEEVFKNDPLTMNYKFSQYINTSDISLVERELNQVLSKTNFSFNGNYMEFEFVDVIDIFTTLRNRYFHMLVGKGQNNFYDINYDKRIIFEGLNPAFLNWLMQIFTAIEQRGVLLFS